MLLTDNEYNTKGTTDFAERLNNRLLGYDEILVSYDVSSLITEVPLDETFNCIVEEIYSNNRLPKLSSKLLYKRFLSVTKNSVFRFIAKLFPLGITSLQNYYRLAVHFIFTPMMLDVENVLYFVNWNLLTF